MDDQLPLSDAATSQYVFAAPSSPPPTHGVSVRLSEYDKHAWGSTDSVDAGRSSGDKSLKFHEHINGQRLRALAAKNSAAKVRRKLAKQSRKRNRK